MDSVAAGAGATVQLSSLSAMLRWTPPLGAAQYHLQVIPALNDGPGVDVIVGDPVQVTLGQFLLASPKLGEGNYLILPGMSYSWRVRFTSQVTPAAGNDPSWGPWSQTGSFRTPAPSSAGIQPAAPLDGATASSTSPALLQWNAPDTALFYFEIQVSGDTRFDPHPATATSFVWWNLVHGGETAPLNSWRTPSLQPGSRYYWRVRPRVQGDGVPVAWSPAWSFTTPGAAPAPVPAPDGASARESAMLTLVNQERAAVGLAALAPDATLRQAARGHSADMVARNYFSHVTPEGLDPFDRMRAAGAQFGYAGENIATAATMERAHAALMDSPGHRENILRVQFRRVGIGIVATAAGGVMITQNFTD